MGIAAYNRGSQLVSRQIEEKQRPDLFRLLDDLATEPQGTVELYQDTIARYSNGAWYLMDRPEDGWSSYAKRFANLREIVRAFRVVITGFAWDELGIFATVKRV